jgi:peptidoglycan glycosyltransferase
VNAPIARLFTIVLLMFVLLIAFTSRWTVFEAKSLRDNALNRRPLLEDQRIHRGLIRAADGTVLARSIKGSGEVYHRTYPAGGLFAHSVGYSYTNLGRSGLEQFYNDELTGKHNELRSIIDQLSGKTRTGDDVITTLDPKAQRVAIAGLAGRKGAVIALDPATGAIKAMASVPSFDPTALRSQRTFRSLATDQQNSPLLDRVTQSGYPPGSTFKVVTAIAAIDSGQYTPQSTVSGKNGIKISGVPLNNDANESFGLVDLTTALTKSINTVWGQVAEKLGKDTMKRYMERLGFDRSPPIDLPAGARRASGEYLHGRVLNPTSRFVDVGRMGIGQDKLNVTPLQMAMVASAVANGGRLMRPHLLDRVVDTDGRTVKRFTPETESVPMSPQTAQEVGQMMTQVVKEGTGTAAALQGIDVAGKTGTAQIVPNSNLTQPWFIAFAPANHPRVAVAVTVERSIGGFGGTVAAPIAKQVMETLLHE